MFFVLHISFVNIIILVIVDVVLDGSRESNSVKTSVLEAFERCRKNRFRCGMKLTKKEETSSGPSTRMFGWFICLFVFQVHQVFIKRLCQLV